MGKIQPTWATMTDLKGLDWPKKEAFYEIAEALWAQHAYGSNKASRRAANRLFHRAILAGVVLQ